MKFQFNDRIDAGVLVVRAGIGSMFVFMHGLPKIAGGVEKWRALGGAFNRLIGVTFLPQFWGFAASTAEFGGGLCLIAGIFFRPACAAMAFTMAVAVAAVFRGGYGWEGATHPLELGIVLVALFLTGPGRFTLPNFFSKTKTSHAK